MELWRLLYSANQDGCSKFRGELDLVFLRNSNFQQQKVSYGPESILSWCLPSSAKSK